MPPSPCDTPSLEEMHDADNPNEPAEVFYAAMAQVHFSVDIRQQCIDGAIVNTGNIRQYLPIHFFQP
ncbi:hypothetical protein TU78_06355 [Pseudomonas taetrolens]|uniref:Uncharacterized protein n=1 Tax=Pseudomonas taetrolens TaxID=47884 RepID=A0A0J6GV94_PSETA|nr:hypothetical protein TU78_06355 [Pseudomonas taetrolens]